MGVHIEGFHKAIPHIKLYLVILHLEELGGRREGGESSKSGHMLAI